MWNNILLYIKSCFVYIIALAIVFVLITCSFVYKLEVYDNTINKEYYSIVNRYIDYLSTLKKDDMFTDSIGDSSEYQSLLQDFKDLYKKINPDNGFNIFNVVFNYAKNTYIGGDQYSNYIACRILYLFRLSNKSSLSELWLKENYRSFSYNSLSHNVFYLSSLILKLKYLDSLIKSTINVNDVSLDIKKIEKFKDKVKYLNSIYSEWNNNIYSSKSFIDPVLSYYSVMISEELVKIYTMLKLYDKASFQYELCVGKHNKNIKNGYYYNELYNFYGKTFFMRKNIVSYEKYSMLKFINASLNRQAAIVDIIKNKTGFNKNISYHSMVLGKMNNIYGSDSR